MASHCLLLGSPGLHASAELVKLSCSSSLVSVGGFLSRNATLERRCVGNFNRLRIASCARTKSSADSQTPESKVSNVMQALQRSFSKAWAKVPEPVRTFPWDEAVSRLVKGLGILLWTHGKWLAILYLLFSGVHETFYCMFQDKEFLVLIGLLAGGLLAKVIKDSNAFEFESEVAGVPWKLLTMGMFFCLLKAPGPNYFYWGRLFLPHLANGGLWQTFWYANAWEMKHNALAGVAGDVSAQGVEVQKTDVSNAIIP